MNLHKWLDHWTFGPNSKIHRLYHMTLHKRLDHWTFGPKLKILRFYQVTLHKWLDLWTFGPKLKFTEYIQWLFINGWTIGPLDQNQRFTDHIKLLILNDWIFWTFTPFGTLGPKSKILRFYHMNLHKWLDLWTFRPKTIFKDYIKWLFIKYWTIRPLD